MPVIHPMDCDCPICRPRKGPSNRLVIISTSAAVALMILMHAIWG